MSDQSSDAQIPPPGAGRFPSPDGTQNPSHWKEALSCLISSKIAIFQMEAKEAAATAAVKTALLLLAGLFLLSAWALLNAGLIGVLSVSWGWSWYDVAFAVAGGHLLFGGLLFLIARSKSSEAFPVTRAEFEKDRKWLDQLKNPSNSEN